MNESNFNHESLGQASEGFAGPHSTFGPHSKPGPYSKPGPHSKLVVDPGTDAVGLSSANGALLSGEIEQGLEVLEAQFAGFVTYNSQRQRLRSIRRQS